MPSSTFFLEAVTPSFIYKPSKFNTKTHLHSTRISTSTPRRVTRRKHGALYSSCRASSSSSSSWVADFDLYELLGVESSSDQTEIKKAYRALQKKCHPDVAGTAGHDMAIILNEVYSLLSDPNSRAAYDQEQAKLSEFKGYTGKPLYSTWFGSANEERAVFVDEVKCVGCLKCALFANKTFAIESVYGRARVIAQWADPEDKILDAIQICPVDCISIVERSNLAALEFLMSKQPRGKVNMTGGSGNTGGVRVSNIFVDVYKFQTRFEEMRDKASTKDSKGGSDLQGDSRASAVQGIRSISNWWYWQAPSQFTSKQETSLIITHNPHRTALPNTDRLKEVAAKLKSRENTKPAENSTMNHRSINNEEYWAPMPTLPSPFSTTPTSEPQQSAPLQEPKNDFQRNGGEVTKKKWNPMTLVLPLEMAGIAAVTIASRHGGVGGRTVVNEHMGGAAALEVVNSFEMQVLLAGVTWFVIGLAIVGVFEFLGGNGLFKRQ